MSHAVTLDRIRPVRTAAVVDLRSTIDRWLPRRRTVADHRPLARVVPFVARETRASDDSQPCRRRPGLDALIEVNGQHGTLHRAGHSIEIAGAGRDLCARLIGLMVREAAMAGRPLVVVVRERGRDLAMSVHPCGSVEALSACCA